MRREHSTFAPEITETYSIMIRFECDYAEGAHPEILKRLAETNDEQTPGYGMDEHCERARSLIRGLCGTDEVDVHFLVGGTQTNKTMIAAALRPHQGVVAAESGHIAQHETGAIESCGHKVLTLPETEGKISAGQIEALCSAHEAEDSPEHTVQPGMVYLSNPTEYGTLYSRSELQAIQEVCRRHGLFLMMDGARLGYGLVAEGNDIQVSDLVQLCDMFYIGGTKVGAFFGEAVVIVNETLKKDFRYYIKQNGGLFAKGRLLGIQFEVLFEGSLYWDISRRAVALAMRIREAFLQKGFRMQYPSPTNQQFFVLPAPVLEKLSEKYHFSAFAKTPEGETIVRICTSWATKEENVNSLIRDIQIL